MALFAVCHFTFVKAEMCRQTSLWIDIRDHHMEKEEGECQVTDGWQDDKLAPSFAGSRSVWFSACTPGVLRNKGNAFTKMLWKIEHRSNTSILFNHEAILRHAYVHLTSSHGDALPAAQPRL